MPKGPVGPAGWIIYYYLALGLIIFSGFRAKKNIIAWLRRAIIIFSFVSLLLHLVVIFTFDIEIWQLILQFGKQAKNLILPLYSKICPAWNYFNVRTIHVKKTEILFPISLLFMITSTMLMILKPTFHFAVCIRTVLRTIYILWHQLWVILIQIILNLKEVLNIIFNIFNLLN